MFANSQMGGLDLGLPNVNLTPMPPAPPVPVPYPSIGLGTTAIPTIPNLFITAMPAHNLATVIPQTNGDNAGLNLGVVSGTVMGPDRPILGSFKCLFGGMPATRMTSLNLQNSTNCPGVRITPSQTKVLVLSA